MKNNKKPAPDIIGYCDYNWDLAATIRKHTIQTIFLWDCRNNYS